MRKLIMIDSEDHHKIPTHVWESSSQNVKGVLQIVHGMSEHSLRYQHVAHAFAQAGFHVYADDHRGHGKSIPEGKKGHFADARGWELVISDLFQVREFIHKQHPNRPVIMLGHSMGSFMAQQFMIQHGTSLNACILTGSNFSSPTLMQIARFIPWIESKRIGGQGHSKLIDRITFGDFNRDFKPNRTEFDWLSRDPEVADRYILDPLCGFLCTNQLWFDLLTGLANIFNPENQKLIPSELPILILGGALDPVSKGGGLEKLEQSFQNAGLQKLSRHIFAGARHEILNELNKEEVLGIITAWLENLRLEQG